MNFRIRWYIRQDLDQILDIENDNFLNPWGEKDFVNSLRSATCIALTALASEPDEEDKITGFVLYELCKSEIRLLNFAVDKKFQRKGIGRQIIEKIIGKLSAHKRNKITATIRETNLGAQLFFKKMGFKATKVERAFYEDSGEDGYRMEYTLPGTEMMENLVDSVATELL